MAWAVRAQYDPVRNRIALCTYVGMSDTTCFSPHVLRTNIECHDGVPRVSIVEHFENDIKVDIECTG